MAVTKNDIKEDVGKYAEQKLKLTGSHSTMKADLTWELCQYVDTKVSAEVSEISNSFKRFRGDVYTTVEQIASLLQNEASFTVELRSRLERIES
jgi:hypothetical protein